MCVFARILIYTLQNEYISNICIFLVCLNLRFIAKAIANDICIYQRPLCMNHISTTHISVSVEMLFRIRIYNNSCIMFTMYSMSNVNLFPLLYRSYTFCEFCFYSISWTTVAISTDLKNQMSFNLATIFNIINRFFCKRM